MANEVVMCRSCGNFVQALKTEGGIEPFKDECPECGGKEFKHNDTDEVIELD